MIVPQLIFLLGFLGLGGGDSGVPVVDHLAHDFGGVAEHLALFQVLALSDQETVLVDSHALDIVFGVRTKSSVGDRAVEVFEETVGDVGIHWGLHVREFFSGGGGLGFGLVFINNVGFFILRAFFDGGGELGQIA